MVATGCASGVKFADMQSTMPELKPDLGRIYIYRTAVIGTAIQPDVYLNDEKAMKDLQKCKYTGPKE